MSDIEKHTLYYKSKLFIVSIDNIGNHEVHGTFFANCDKINILYDTPRNNKDSIIGLTINCFGNRGAGQDDILKKRAKDDNFTISKTNVPIFFIKSETENNTSNYLFKEKRNISEEEEKNDFTIKLRLELDNQPLVNCDIDVKFSGGEMSGKLSAKHKFELSSNFNYLISKKD
jgi:hypothetical protein